MAIFPFSVDSVRIGTANITASGGNIVLPAGTQVGNQTVATVVEVSTGGGPKITNLQITDNSWTVLDDTAVDTAGGYVLITGTNFVSGAQVYLNQNAANSVAFVSATTLRVTVPALTAGTYIVYVINPDGGTAIRVPGLTASANPAWQTASALPDQYDGVAISLSLVATDATSYTITSGSLPPGLSLNTGTGAITGTVTGVTVDTVYTFTVRATDAQLQDSPRTFTVTITVSDPYFKLTTLLLSGSALSANSVVRDSSTNNFNLTVYGDARASNFTPYGTGWSVQFDGNGDYLSIPTNAALNLSGGDFTIEGWVHWTGSNAGGTILNKDGVSGSSYPSYLLGLNSSGYFRGAVGSGNGTTYFQTITSSVLAPINQWVHLAFVKNGTTLTLYQNGTNVGSATQTGTIVDGAKAVLIGYETGQVATTYWSGYVSNTRIVKGTAVYTANFTPATTNLTSVANTSLLTCHVNSFRDASANNFTITPNGDAKVVSFNPFNITNTGVDGSMYFDGTGDYVWTSDNAAFTLGTNNFTIECWLYNNSTGARKFIAGQGNSVGSDASGSFSIQKTAGNKLQGSINSAGPIINSVASSSDMPLNSWVHCAFVREGTTLRLYMNGVQVGTTTGISVSVIDSSNNVALGAAGEYVSADTWIGYIADFRIVNGTCLYPSGTSFTPPTTLLTAVANTQLLSLQYDQPHNNHTFLDSSSNQFLITRSGNATQGTFSPFSQVGWSNYFTGSSTNALTVATGSGVAFGTGDFCQEFFLYANSYPSMWRIISYSVVCASMLQQSGAVLNIDTGVGTLNTGITLPTNTWFHLAYTRQSGRVRIFVDGVLRYNVADTTSYGNASVDIGGAAGFSQSWDGYISNARIIKGSVPAAYQTSSTTNGTSIFTSPTGPLTAVTGTELLTCQSNRFVDSNTQTTAKTITVTGSPRVTAFSPFAPTAVYSPVTHGGSGYFDGTGDYLTAPDSTAFNLTSGNFTLEAWVYWLGSGDQKIFSKDGKSGVSYNQYALYVNGSLNATVGSGNNTSYGQFLIDPVAFEKNTWVHVAFVKNGSQLTLYKNGTSVATAAQTGIMVSGGRALYIGYEDSQPSSTAWNGYISNARIVKGTAVYTGNFTPPTKLLAASGADSAGSYPSTTNVNTSFASSACSLLLNFTDAAIPDSTGRSVVETVADAKSTSVVTKFTGGSMYFDSAGDYLTVPYSIALQFPGDFTVECWVNLISKVTSNPCIVNNYSTYTTNGGFAIFASHGNGTAGKYNVSFNGSFPVINSTTSISYGSWQHIALVRSGTTLTLYVDGVANGTSTQSATVIGTANYWWIGAAGDTIATSYLNGYINDLRVTKGHARYTTAFTPPTAPARLK